MDLRTADILRSINNEFYERNAVHFASTRNNSWRGWQRAFEVIDAKAPGLFVVGGSDDEPNGGDDSAGNSVHVLDVACGNLRFESWLAGRYPGASIAFHGVDNCTGLLPDGPNGEGGLDDSVRFQELDVLGALFDGGHEAVSQAIDGDGYDVVCSFGFMHHVPGLRNRQQLMRALASKARPGGFVVVSLWQFMNSSELADRARESHAAGLSRYASRGLTQDSLEPGDFLLGWNGEEGAFRFCHHFTETEMAWLTMGAGELARPVASFSCDGRTDNLNGYLVLQRF